MSFSRSCDCLAQTEISSVLTPRNEQMPPNPESQFLHFKRVDISLETSDSEATSSAGKNLSKQASMRLPASSSATSEPTTASVAANQRERQSRLMQQQDYESQRDRSKSPRPQTLPGLKMSASTASSEDRRPTSPQVSSLLHSLLLALLCVITFKSLKHAVCTNFLFIWGFFLVEHSALEK